MNRIFTAIALVSICAAPLTGCTNDPESDIDVNGSRTPAPDTRITLDISAPDFVGYDQQDMFIVSLSESLDRDITIGVASSDPSKALVPDYVILEAGEYEVTGKITPVAEGKASISIFCADSDLKITKAFDDLLVMHPQPAVNGEILSYAMNKFNWDKNYPVMPAKVDNNYWILPIIFPSSDHFKDSPGSQEGWRSACLYLHNMSWEEYWVRNYSKSTIDNFGCAVVGKMVHGMICMTLLDKNVIIDSSLPWIENTFRDRKSMGKDDGASGCQCTPNMYSYRFTENVGRTGYLVTRLAFKDEAKGVPFGFYRAWIEVSINEVGDITFLKTALCCNNREFKTGQEKN